MSWVKLDDQFTQHPKVLEAGPMAAWFHVCGLSYCARYLTDGFIPASVLPSLADFSRITDPPGDLAYMLVKARLWEECEGGFKVHDYLEYNPSRAQVMADRKANAERVANWKARKRGNAVTNALVTAPEGNAVTNAAPVPVPVLITSTTETVVEAADKPQLEKPTKYEDWLDLMSKADGAKAQVAVLVDMVRSLSKRPPPTDKVGGRAAAFLGTLSGDGGYAVRLLWDAIPKADGDVFSYATKARNNGRGSIIDLHQRRMESERGQYIPPVTSF